MKKSTKIIIAVVAIIAIAAAVVGTLFLTGVLGSKKPQKGFYEYLEKAVSSEDSNAKSYSDYIETFKKIQTEPSLSKEKVTMDVKLGGELAEYKEIAELLSKVELNMETKADPSKKVVSTSIGVKYDGKEIGTFDAIANDKKFGIKLGDAYEKYLTLDYDYITDAFEDALDSTELDIPSSFSLGNNVDIEKVLDLIEIKEEELERIAKKYKDVVKKTIPEKNYSSKKEKIKVNGKDVNATGYTLEVSSKDAMDVLKAICEALKDDDDTLDLIADKFNQVMKLSGQRMTISKTMLKAGIEQIVGTLDTDSISDSGEKLKITIYENGNKVVRLAVEVADTAVYIDTTKDGDTEKSSIKIKTDGEEITLLNIEQTKKGDDKYTTVLSTEIQGVELKMTLDTQGSDKLNGKMYVKYEDIIELTMNIDSEVEYGSVNVDKLTSSNSVDVTTISTTEQQKLILGLLGYVEDKMDVVEDIAEVLGYEDEVKALSTQLKALKSSSSTTTTTTTTDTEAE